MKQIFKSIASLIGILVLIIIFIRLFFPIYSVATASMKPTISEGDYVVVSRFHYKIFEPNKNDIVLFEPIDEIFELGPWTHRIIAIEGDRVSIVNNMATVNNDATLFPEVDNTNLSVNVQKGFVFQKGDNKKTIVGVVPKEKIIGKVIFSF